MYEYSYGPQDTNVTREKKKKRKKAVGGLPQKTC